MLFYEMIKNENYRDVHYAKSTDWFGIKCPEYEEHQRSGKRIGELKIDIKTKKVGDFMSTFLSEWIISNKAYNIFLKNSIKGYEVKPIKISSNELSNTFWEFRVTGSGGDANPDSGIYLKMECQYCGLKKYSAYENGIIIDETRWDGSDIFTITGYERIILVTEKVKSVIEKNGLKGVKFIPSHELEWPKGVIKP